MGDFTASDALARIAARLAAPKAFAVVTRFERAGETCERRLETETRGQAENHATGERRKIGRDLTCTQTGLPVRVFAVEILDILPIVESVENNETRIARAFAQRLRAALTPDQWEATRGRNATPEYAGASGPCASHDYCDANDYMAEAFAEIMGRDILPDNGEGMTDSDCALWNQAWQIAKRDHLTGESV